MAVAASPLLTDLDQFNLVEAGIAGGMTGAAVVAFVVRRRLPVRSFLIAAGHGR